MYAPFRWRQCIVRDVAFLPFARPDITEAEISAVCETMRSGWLTTGPNSAQFEQEFLEFLGADAHAVAVNSATAGLHLAFEAIGVQPGDEVLVPTWTFTSTAEAVRYLGGDPVLVDVDPSTLCIDLEDAERKVTERTVAIAPVHFAGLGVPDGSLTAFAQRHGLRVVEDAAHALPTLNEGTLIGAHGHDATVYSFYATKTMTTGEGGMVVTPDADLAARMRTMRLHGINRDVFDRYSSKKPSWHYDVVAPGYKYNLTDTAAAMDACSSGARRRWPPVGPRLAPATTMPSLACPSPCQRTHPRVHRTPGTCTSCGSPTTHPFVATPSSSGWLITRWVRAFTSSRCTCSPTGATPTSTRRRNSPSPPRSFSAV